MKATTAKAMREARRRLALSRQFADPVMRQTLDALAVEAATREYVRRDEMGAQAGDILVNRTGVMFELGRRAWFCPVCHLVMQQCAYDDAFECMWCKTVRRRGVVLDTCQNGFPDINGKLLKAEPVASTPWWRRALRLPGGVA